MNRTEIAVVSVVASVATTWITAKVMREFKLPGYAGPLVGAFVGVAVNNAMRRLL